MLSGVKRGAKALHIYEDNHNHKHNKNKRKIASVGLDVEKLEPHMACDNVNGITSLGNPLLLLRNRNAEITPAGGVHAYIYSQKT